MDYTSVAWRLEMEERGNEKKDVPVKKKVYDDAIEFVNKLTRREATKDPSHHPHATVPEKGSQTNEYSKRSLAGTQANHTESMGEVNQTRRVRFRLRSFSSDPNSLRKKSDAKLHEQFFFKKSEPDTHLEKKQDTNHPFFNTLKNEKKHAKVDARVAHKDKRAELKGPVQTTHASGQNAPQGPKSGKAPSALVNQKKTLGEKKDLRAVPQVNTQEAPSRIAQSTVDTTRRTKKEKKPLFGTQKAGLPWRKKQKTTPQNTQSMQTLAVQKNVLSAETMDALKTLVLPVKQEILKHEGLNGDEWKEQDFYSLIEPFATVSILQNSETKERRYVLIELPLTPEEKEHHRFIVDAMNFFSINANDIQTKGIEGVFEHKIQEIISDYRLSIPPLSEQKIMYWLKKEFLGLGILEPLMKDGSIEDISCDGSTVHLFIYHRRFGSIQSNVLFTDEEELSSFVMRLAQRCGKYISIANPMLDATMPDGSRIQMTLSTEVSTKGSTFTIRKFKENPLSPADLVGFNTMSAEMMAYMWMAVQYGANALIAGGTASGKTSTLNAMALFIPRESKIVSIEETREINLPHPNWIPGVTRTGFGGNFEGKLTGEIDLYDLMKAALRQRPEYIIVGEIRGKEAYVLFQAMATGHTTYSTVHADSTKSLIHRLEGEPINIPRIMLHSLDIICIQTIARIKDKRVRRCKQIIEIIDIDPTTKEILTNEVFRWDPITDTYQYTGKSFFLDTIRQKTNQTSERIIEEMHQRARLLHWLVSQNIHDFDEVASLTANYYDNPNEVMGKVKG